MNMFASQRGSVLLSVVVAITLLAAISYMLSFQGAGQANMTSGEVERDRLRYVAEAGIAHARLQLAQNTSCDNFADIPTTGFAGETYTASISPRKDSPVRIKASVDLGDGNKLNLYRDAVPAYQPSVAIELQLTKTGGQDAILDDFYPNRNYGGANYVQINSASWQQRPVLQFDLSSIPAGVKIVSAQLELLQQSMNNGGAVAVHRMTRDWVEGTRNGGGTSDGADWQTHDGTSSWAQLGGEFDATVYGVTQVSGAKSGGWVAWDIGDLVQEWVSGASPNYGLLLAGDGVVTGAKYASKDTSDPLQAPKLTIAYACECGKTCDAVPPAGKNVLLVVADAGNPSASESDRMSLIESWGHTVTLISDHASQADFDTAFADADVAYIAGSGSSGEVGTKLTAATIGVLSEDIGLVDKLGIAEPAFLKRSSQAINVIDNTHYVTDGFGLGTLQLYTYTPQIWTVTGALAPGLQVLGETQDGGSSYPTGLAVLESGAELWGGGSAAGRRVQVPWSEGSFDINGLNADGQTIFQRAIEWGAGAGAAACESTTPLLFVVSDDTAPTTQEAARQTLLESWCYSITLIDDSDSQSNFDTAAANADVAYISAEVSAATLGTKLKDNSIGIVNEDPDLHNDYGFSTVRYRAATNAPLATVDSHYITSPFGGSSITLYTSDQRSGAAVGTLPAGLVSIGDWSSGDLSPLDGLLTLDTGATISGGGTAAGRRVQLPWDGDEGGVVADIGALTADGRTVLQRSLEWAAGAGSIGASGLIAHWKLDETSGTTAADSEGGHHGTLPNGGTWTTGSVDGALQFNGTNHYINVPHDDTLSLTTFSISAWVQATSLSGWQIVVSKGGASGWNYYLGTNDSEISIGFQDGGTWAEFPTTGAGLVTGQWYHLAGTFDDASGEAKIYLDGALIHSETTALHPIATTDAVTIGTSPAGEDWPGILDDVRIYNRVLDATETAALAASGSGGGGGGGATPPVFEEFTETKDPSGEFIDISKPGGTAIGDLLIAAVATDGAPSSLAAPAGWNEISVGDNNGGSDVTLGVWWKMTDSGEPSQYRFTWSGTQESYGWIMRFTGHDPGSPVATSAVSFGSSKKPLSTNLITSTGNNLILRLGGFDDDDINYDAPGLPGHTAITMDQSSEGQGTVSGGAGYTVQTSAGDTGTSNFDLLMREEYRTVTIAIRAAP